MPGKNQNKRIQKSIAHAEMVWEREQIQAATAKKTLDEAYQTIKENSEEIEPDKMALIEAEVSKRNDEIEAFVLKARDKYLAKIAELSQQLS